MLFCVALMLCCGVVLIPIVVSDPNLYMEMFSSLQLEGETCLSSILVMVNQPITPTDTQVMLLLECVTVVG